MRNPLIPSSLFSGNRARLQNALPPGAALILLSNDVPQTNADGTRAFVQNSNLYWLTGIAQEETVLIFFPDSPVQERKEILFIRQTNEHLAIWEGQKLSKADAASRSGIGNVQWVNAFENVLKRVFAETDLVFLSVDHHPGRTLGPMSRNHRFASWCREEFPLHQFRNVSPLIEKLRLIKSAEEIDCIRHAGRITIDAFHSAAKSVKPGIYEYAVEAEMIRTILLHGSPGFAYEPIIASGENSCVLHYVKNDALCNDGDVLLIDAGALYAGYAADMTRTFPSNGRFTKRQKEIYRAVLKIFVNATKLFTPGTSFSEYNAAVDAFADEVLMDLGLLSTKDLRKQDPKQPARGEYFLHKTAHSLGLDVHDPGDTTTIFSPGMVFTCEPGLYLREENLGIRLENNLVITTDGHEDLMAGFPLDPDEIEALMQEK